MGPLGWILITSDGSPHKKRKCGHTKRQRGPVQKPRASQGESARERERERENTHLYGKDILYRSNFILQMSFALNYIESQQLNYSRYILLFIHIKIEDLEYDLYFQEISIHL